MKKLNLALVTLSSAFVLAACGSNQNQANQASSSEATSQAASSQATSQTESQAASSQANANVATGIENQEFAISLADATAIFNEQQPQAGAYKVEFEEEDGRYVYNFHGYDDTYDYEVEVDAQTGDVVAQEMESQEGARPEIQFGTFKSPEEIIELALAHTAGAVVEGWTIEFEGDTLVYEVDLTGDVDLIIDANSGDVIRED
ncbi:hypothetical protein AWM75_05600 [Aerococcus urinaehominis]|uniref:Uncharacterized protein n=1 Tax=Aerococcus urinaehominis TaxID=128944 RepID=A0A109RH91_9LACT|nr:PepSY domain-containing protein [Aerococcus urinaehominis]AMB99501.1 hypothetical protein AWM75_05600 [Aerococcus urinaehominis]SDM26250.1 Uncharacterized membrane protein YkoI [Aerococcus urinaehominis]